MGEFTIVYETSLSDAFFLEDEDNRRFDEWFEEKLTPTGLYGWELKDTCTTTTGTFELVVRVNDYNYNNDHKLVVVVEVDDDAHSYDELADNKELGDYIERTLAYKILDEINELCKNISYPTNNGTFDDMKFDDNEFFGLIHYHPQYGFYLNPQIRNSQFELYKDFDVYL